MSNDFQEWLRSDHVRLRLDPATDNEIQQLESEIGHELPNPLRELMANGSPEGFYGESYIAFWGASDIATSWRESQVMAAGFVPFASNGGGEWYGYDARYTERPFVLMPAIGIDWRVAMLLGNDWDSFLDVLKRGDLFVQDYIPQKT